MSVVDRGSFHGFGLVVRERHWFDVQLSGRSRSWRDKKPERTDEGIVSHKRRGGPEKAKSSRGHPSQAGAESKMPSNDWPDYLRIPERWYTYIV